MVPHADSPGLGLGLPLIAQLAERFEVSDHVPEGSKLQMTFARAPAPDRSPTSSRQRRVGPLPLRASRRTLDEPNVDACWGAARRRRACLRRACAGTIRGVRVACGVRRRRAIAVALRAAVPVEAEGRWRRRGVRRRRRRAPRARGPGSPPAGVGARWPASAQGCPGRGVAFEHAIGDEDHPVAGLELELLHPQVAPGARRTACPRRARSPRRRPSRSRNGRGCPALRIARGLRTRSMRTSWPVTNLPAREVDAAPRCAAAPARAGSLRAGGVLRSAPTTSVASIADSTVWPMASVIDTCSVLRSSEKSNVSPPTSPAGSSHPASVN